MSVDITIKAYASYSLVLELKDSDSNAINLSTYTAGDFIGQLSEGPNKVKKAEFAFEILEGGTTGKVKMSLTPEQTTSLRGSTTLMYDAFWTVDASTRHQLIEGTATITPNISRE
jgi:hypothetical protein